MNNTKQLFRWGFAFSVLTGLLLSLIATRFIEYMPDISGLKSMIFLVTGLFSHFSLLTLLVFVIGFMPLALLSLTSNKLQRPIQVISIISATLAALLLIADTFVYAQYRFHLSGFVFEMMLQAGNDVIALSWVTWLTIILVSIASFVCFTYVGKTAQDLVNRDNWPKLKKRYLWLFTISFLTSNLIHLVADATYDKSVTSLVRHVPLFSPLTGKKTVLKSGLLDAEAIRAERTQLKSKISTDINYPKAELTTAIPDSPLNVLLILVDSLRFDVVTPEVMPNISQFANGPSSQVFNQHISGGNSTRTGVFNLFYGIPGTYWNAFSTNQIAPVLMDTFQQHDYETQILAAAPLTHPAFDRTVFAGIDDLKLRAKGNAPWQLDQDITENWLQFIEQRQTSADQAKPFFGFLFFDGVHGYSLPENQQPKFTPSWQRVDHLALNPDFDPTPYFNLYKNAANVIDQHIGKILAQLKKYSLDDNTVIIITSDHGQEFNDNQLNYWGHGSNFTDVQVHVPYIMHWPNKPARKFEHRTSHSDVSVTLMQDLFNTSNPTTDYSLGYHLEQEQRESWTIAGSYVNYAIIEKDHHIVTYQNGDYEVLDHTGRVSPTQEIAPNIALKAMQALSFFYK